MTIAQPRTVPNTRELRALALYRDHGEEICHLYGSIYRVPSQDGQRSYDVEYGAHEECPCPDHLYRGVTCVHLYALGIAMAKGRFRHPEVRAGDPFTAAPHHDDEDERPHACNDGWITLGQVVADPETGEEIEEYALYLCRRCTDNR